MTFTFTATQDTVDDEGESVLLGFGPDLSGGVSAGTPDETTLTITDDDPPEVSFGQSAYTVAEGGMVSVEVKLTSAPASAVTVPLAHTPQGATSSDRLLRRAGERDVQRGRDLEGVHLHRDAGHG